jgi:hypothetical protein
MIERSLAPADAAEIETQRGEAPVREGVIELVHDRIVHRPAELRVRVQDDRNRRISGPAGVKTPLDPSVFAGKNHFRHRVLRIGRGDRVASRANVALGVEEVARLLDSALRSA